jgi:Tfp pilus assembly protein PilO
MLKKIFPILLIIIAITLFFWYIKPAYQDTEATRSQIEEYETSLSQITEIQEIRDNLLRKYNQLPQTNIYVVNRVLPESLDEVRLLVELNQIALPYNLRVQDIEFTNRSDSQESLERQERSEAPRKVYEFAQVSFSVKGSYADAVTFARDVEKSTRLIDITGFTGGLSDNDRRASGIEEGPPSGQDNTYTITGITYWLPNQNL